MVAEGIQVGEKDSIILCRASGGVFATSLMDTKGSSYCS